MKLLFLTEKPGLKKWIEQEFTRHRDVLSYTIDVACVNNFIISDEETGRMHMHTDGLERFTMKTRTVPNNYKIFRDYLPDHKEELLSMLRNNDYAYIVNACDPDEAGGLMFDYTRESCGALDIPTLRFDMFALLCKLQAEEAFKKLEAQLK